MVEERFVGTQTTGLNGEGGYLRASRNTNGDGGMTELITTFTSQQASQAVQFKTNISNQSQSPVIVTLEQLGNNNEWIELGRQSVTHTSELTFDATTLSTNQLRLKYGSANGIFNISSVLYNVKDVLEENYLTTICSNDPDFDEDYRFGFNGQEKDNEIKGTGNSLSYEARIYDSRLGRWLTPDPLQSKYPSFSVYQGLGNNPIYFKDLDGRVLVDKNGKIIYEVVKDSRGNPAIADVYDYRDNNYVYHTVVTQVNVFGNDGKRIPVQKYSTTAISLQNGTSEEVASKFNDESYNCHGFSSLRGEFRVGSSLQESNALLLDKGGFDKSKDLQSQVNKDISKVKTGDVIVLFDANGVAVHSYKFTGKDYTDNEVDSKNGSTPIQNGMSKKVEDIYIIYKNLGATDMGYFTPVADKKVEDPSTVVPGKSPSPNVGNSTEIK